MSQQAHPPDTLTTAAQQEAARLNAAAIAHTRLNQPEQALLCWAQALHLQPDYAEVHNNRGVLLKRLGRLAEAEAACRHALLLQPHYAEACNNLGTLLQTSQRFQEAEAAYRQALQLRPASLRTLNNLGVLLREMGRHAEAEAVYRQLLCLQPDHANTCHNLGILLHGLDRLAEAEAAYRQAILLQPDHAEAYANLGDLLHGGQRFAEAEAAYRAALHLRPDWAATQYSLGTLLHGLNRFAEAEVVYRQVWRAHPDHGNALGMAYHCARFQCQWQTLDADERAIRQMLARGVAISPFSLLTVSDEDGQLYRQAGALYGAKRAGPLLETPPLVDPRTHPPRERLRVGYLSADFHNHPVAQLVVGVLEGHDPDRFSIHGYSIGPPMQDAYRQRIVQACAVFQDLTAWSARDAAQRIADDGIDILVDLTGYTLHCRPEITAHRPAPILVNWLGYPGTLGQARLADYVIGDPVVSPPAMADQFSETLALLPHCYQPHDRHRVMAPTPTRQAAGLPEDGIVFCNFNQIHKWGPDSFRVWCRLLQAVPDSVLWALEPTATAMTALRQTMQRQGLDPDRLVFAPRQPTADHWGRLALADLALDTFPYTSHTTGSDALWCGVPLLTRMGNTFVSRVAASLLSAVGLPELVTESWAAYFGQALALASQPDRLHGVRACLAAHRLTQPLFATERFTRDLERLYARMWQDHGLGKREMIRLP
ncbi:MAG: tetratricopeptide repeat protein [Magnetococcales bacterium]|nr:tetratricopeptide repeat protein [Magnetococcales bacterium]